MSREASARPTRSTTRRRLPGYDSTLGGVLVRNPFLLVPVEEALSAAGLDLLRLSSIASAHPPLRILVAGLQELGPQGARAVTELRSAGTAVLVFGRSEHAVALRALQACGALTAERTPFLVNLPELITLALDTGRC